MTIDQNDQAADPFGRGDDEEARGPFYRERPFWWLKKEGDTAVLRFLELPKDWVKGPTHRFFPTKPKPEGHEGNWPEMMPATCRDGVLSRMFPQGCAMCTSGYEGKYGKGSKPEDTRYTLAVEREEYTDENGAKGYRDKEIQVPLWNAQTGEVSKTETMGLPSIVIVGESMWRMMSALKGLGEALEDIRTQDIRLKLGKNPNGNGLVISPVPIGFDKDVMPGNEHWQMYQHAIKLWKPGGLAIGQELLHRASDEYWNELFLMPNGRTYAEMKAGGGASSGGFGQSSSRPAQQAASAGSSEQPTDEELEEMRNRIMKNRAPSNG